MMTRSRLRMLREKTGVQPLSTLDANHLNHPYQMFEYGTSIRNYIGSMCIQANGNYRHDLVLLLRLYTFINRNVLHNGLPIWLKEAKALDQYLRRLQERTLKNKNWIHQSLKKYRWVIDPLLNEMNTTLELLVPILRESMFHLSAIRNGHGL